MSNFARLQELLKQKKASLKGAARSIKPDPGKTTYALLPPWRGDSDPTFWHDFGQHFVKDESNKIQAVYVCSSATFGTPCPVCSGLSEAQRAIGTTNPAMAELIKQARSSTKYMINVVALDGSKASDDPQVLELGKKAFEQLVTTAEEWGDQLFSTTNPQIIQIERVGTTQNDTVYTVTVTPRKHTFKKAVKPINLDEWANQENEEAKKKILLTMSSLYGTSSAPRLSAPVTKAAEQFTDVPDFPKRDAKADMALTADIDDLMAELEQA